MSELEKKIKELSEKYGMPHNPKTFGDALREMAEWVYRDAVRVTENLEPWEGYTNSQQELYWQGVNEYREALERKSSEVTK